MFVGNTLWRWSSSAGVSSSWHRGASMKSPGKVLSLSRYCPLAAHLGLGRVLLAVKLSSLSRHLASRPPHDHKAVVRRKANRRLEKPIDGSKNKGGRSVIGSHREKQVRDRVATRSDWHHEYPCDRGADSWDDNLSWFTLKLGRWTQTHTKDTAWVSCTRR